MANYYQEEEDSSFTHDGKRYNLNCVLRRVQEYPIERIPVQNLRWILAYTPSEFLQQPGAAARLARADLTAPILVAVSKEEGGRFAVIDGLHRLMKAVKDRVKTLPARRVTASDLLACEIS